MITQKSISLKIDKELLVRLDVECYVSAKKRNAVINQAISEYIELMDFRREYNTRCSRVVKEDIVYSWLHDRFPEAYNEMFG